MTEHPQVAEYLEGKTPKGNIGIAGDVHLGESARPPMTLIREGIKTPNNPSQQKNSGLPRRIIPGDIVTKMMTTKDRVATTLADGTTLTDTDAENLQSIPR